MPKTIQNELKQRYLTRVKSNIPFFVILLVGAAWFLYNYAQYEAADLPLLLLLGAGSLAMGLLIEFLIAKYIAWRVGQVSSLVRALAIILLVYLPLVSIHPEMLSQDGYYFLFAMTVTGIPLWDIIRLLMDLQMLRDGTCRTLMGRVATGKNNSYKTVTDDLTGESVTFKDTRLLPDRIYRVYYLPHSKVMVPEMPEDEAYEEKRAPTPEPSAIGGDPHIPRDAEVKNPLTPALQKVLWAVALIPDLAALVLVFVLGTSFLLPLFFLVFGQIFFGAYAIMKAKASRCAKYVMGRVVDVHISHSKYGTTEYPIIEYVVDGKAYVTEGDEGLPHYEIGSDAWIYFNPKDPTDTTQNSSEDNQIFGIIGGIFRGVGLVILLFMTINGFGLFGEV